MNKSSKYVSAYNRTDRRDVGYPIALRGKRGKGRARRRHSFLKPILISLLIVIIIITAGVIVANNTLQPFSDRFYPGVYVDGASLAGMTKQEAYDLINSQAEARLRSWIMPLSYNNTTWTLTPASLQMMVDAADQVNRAYLQGRTGALTTRLLTIWKLKTAPYNGYTSIFYNEYSLDAMLASIKQEIDVPAVDAVRTADPNRTPPYRYSNEQPGVTLDTDAIRDELIARVDDLNTSPFFLTTQVVQPAVKVADLVNDNTRLSRSITRIATTSTAERTANVALGCERFNGLIIEPGKTVSFNETTGKRTPENGFMEALEIVYGEYVMGVGGGICQVSSTLYGAVIEAGLEIVDRTAHALPVSYLDPGKDATVADRGTDFVFRNNTDYSVSISARVEKSNGTLNCVFEIFGHPNPNGYTYSFIAETVETIPIPEPRIIQDKKAEYVTYTNQTKQVGKGAVGFVANSFKVTIRNGQEISRDFIKQDTYRPQAPTIYVGMTPRE